MDLGQKFMAFAQAFEDAYETDNWTGLAAYFAPDAVYLPGDGQTIVGRDNVLAFFKASVDGLDKRFDQRIPVFGDPVVDEFEVSVPWRFTYRVEGAPDLASGGVETALFSDGMISRLESIFDEGVGESFQAWFKAHQHCLTKK